MSKFFPSRTWIWLGLPAAAFLGLALMLNLHSAAAEWTRNAAFACLPYILYAVAVLLGAIFAQTRISLIGLLLAVVTWLADSRLLENTDPAKGLTGILLSGLYVPLVAAALYHMEERGLLTTHGALRGFIVVSSALMILALPQFLLVTELSWAGRWFMLKSALPWIRIPPLTLLSLGAGIALLLARKQKESPLLGPMLAMALLFVFGGLNHATGAWAPALSRAGLLSFMSGGAVILSLATLETSWRNANIDALTELPGRHALDRHLAALRRPYAIAVADVDHFKKVNDRYGHSTGDQVLRFVASFFKQFASGKAYRYGGEEFVLICEGSDFAATVEALERLRKAIRNRRFGVRGRHRPKEKPESRSAALVRRPLDVLSISISIGVAEGNEGHADSHEVLRAADKALYRAKREGRNRVVIAK